MSQGDRRGNQPGDIVTDSRGSTHVLTRRLGTRGSGFGRLWLTQDPSILIKIMSRRPPDLTTVDLLGLPAARPLALLRSPTRGQVLQLEAGASEIDELVTSVPTATQLAILRRTAEVLAVLHSAGWVFGDLNPRNILAWPDSAEVVLVDLDTLARNRVSFAHQPSGAITKARVKDLLPPWGQLESPAQIEDTELLSRYVTQAVGGVENLLTTGPATSAVVGEISCLTHRPAVDKPSMGTLWRAMCRDEDLRRRCVACGSLHCRSEGCPMCSFVSPATRVTVTSRTAHQITSHTIFSDARNAGVVRRRHLFPGARPENDGPRYLVEVRGRSASVRSESEGAQLPLGVPVEVHDDLGTALLTFGVSHDR